MSIPAGRGRRMRGAGLSTSFWWASYALLLARGLPAIRRRFARDAGLADRGMVDEVFRTEVVGLEESGTRTARPGSVPGKSRIRWAPYAWAGAARGRMLSRFERCAEADLALS